MNGRNGAQLQNVLKLEIAKVSGSQAVQSLWFIFVLTVYFFPYCTLTSSVCHKIVAEFYYKAPIFALPQFQPNSGLVTVSEFQLMEEKNLLLSNLQGQ